MAQSQPGFVGPTGGSGAPSDQAVPFQFVVTWTSLFVTADPPKMPSEVSALAGLNERSRSAPVAAAPRVVPLPEPAASPVSPAAAPTASANALVTTSKTVAPARTSSDLALAVPRKAGSAGGFQWEMVVPKMVRTAKKAAPRSRRAGESTAPLEQTPPNLYTASSNFRKSFSLKLCAGVLGAAAIVVPLWKHAARPASNTVQTSIDGGDWVREASSGGDPGVKQSRQLVLYRPALKSKDSRLEFAWTVASGDVGLVFRAKDLGNYYAIRLKVLKAGATPTLAAEYFSVYQFVESPHTEKVLVFSRNDPTLLVRLDIFGPTFTLYLQDNATEFWTDARMTSGALGFFEEWNRGAEVRGLRMSFPERSQLLQPLDDGRSGNTILGFWNPVLGGF
jgi:hypothetical protein